MAPRTTVHRLFFLHGLAVTEGYRPTTGMTAVKCNIPVLFLLALGCTV